MHPTKTLLAVAILASTSGCLLSHTHKRVFREKEPVRTTHFESDEVARKFNTHVADSDRKAEGSSFSLGIPFLLGLSGQSVPSRNAFYNDQVAHCDTDANGFLSAAEVEAYLAR